MNYLTVFGRTKRGRPAAYLYQSGHDLQFDSGADTQLFLIESAEGYWQTEQAWYIMESVGDGETAAALYPAAVLFWNNTPGMEIDLF